MFNGLAVVSSLWACFLCWCLNYCVTQQRLERYIPEHRQLWQRNILKVSIELAIYTIFPIMWLVYQIWKPGGNRPGFCTSCSYNLTGNVSGVCPECGTVIENFVQAK
jgi:hypothetical protein